MSRFALMPALMSMVMAAVAVAARAGSGYDPYYQVLAAPLLVALVLYGASFLVPKREPAAMPLPGTGSAVRRTIAVFSCVLILISFIGRTWGTKYAAVFFEDQFIAGSANKDMLFHSALSNMLLGFGRIGTGVGGLNPFNYHFLSHAVLAGLGALFGTGTWVAYHLLYPIVMFPILLGMFLLAVEGTSRIYKVSAAPRAAAAVGTLVFAIQLIGVLPESIRESLGNWNSEVLSPSYTTALVLLYFFFIAAVRLETDKPSRYRTTLKLVFGFFASLLLTLSKVSVGTLWVYGVFAVFLIDKDWKKGVPKFALAGIGWLAGMILSYRDLNQSGFSFFHFLRNYFGYGAAVFPLVHYAWSAAAIFLLFYAMKKKLISDWMAVKSQVVVAGVVFFGFIPGLLLAIDGGSAWYFTNVNLWVALPIVAVLGAEALSSVNIKVLAGRGKPYSQRGVLLLSALLALNFGLSMAVNAGVHAVSAYTRNTGYREEVDPAAKAHWDAIVDIRREALRSGGVRIDGAPVYSRGVAPAESTIVAYLSVPAILGVPVFSPVRVDKADPLTPGEARLIRGYLGEEAAGAENLDGEYPTLVIQ